MGISYSNVIVGLGITAPLVVGVGCSLAGGSDFTDAAGATDNGEHDDFSFTAKPKRICVELFTAQTSHAGTVCMTIEPRVAMNVDYMTTGGWELIDAHLALGDSMSDIPIDDKGNSQLGQFAFNSGDITGATSHTFVVPLCDYHLDGHAHIAAHATLRKRNADGTWQTETGWGLEKRIIDGSDWATQFTVSLECGAQEPPQLETCETAFAKGDASTCFIGADFDGDGSDDGIERWGWSNGPLAPGTGAAWPVYAASSQCDVARSTRVGSLSVSYGREGNVQIVFDRVGDFVLAEEHLHVGTEPLPRGKDGRFTIAPGRYPIVRKLDDATHSENQVGGLEGDIYVAYHATA